MLGGMGMGMGDKTVRELFVGNTPQGTSDFVLMEFLNAAMKQVRAIMYTSSDERVPRHGTCFFFLRFADMRCDFAAPVHEVGENGMRDLRRAGFFSFFFFLLGKIFVVLVL